MRTREEQISELAGICEDAGILAPGAAHGHAEDILNEAEQRVRAEIGGSLKDPSTVHVNMLRGSIATPTWEQFLHLFPKERAEIGRDSERLDWFEENCAGAKSQWNEKQSLVEWQVKDGEWFPDLRTAIDAVREGE